MSEDKEIKMPNFLVDIALEDCVNALSDTQAGRLFKLLFKYAEGFEIDENQLNSGTRIALSAFKPSIDKGRKKYLNVVKRNRENGKKGGRPKEPKKNTQNPMEILEPQKTQTNPKKQNKLNKSKLVSKDTNLRLKGSSQGLPEGQPAPRPEHYELREFFEKQFGYDDAYFCSEFTFAMSKHGNDWQNWQRKMLAYAVKTGRASYE